MKENLSSDEEALGDSSPAYIGTNQFLCLAGRHHSGDGGLPHQTPEHDTELFHSWYLSVGTWWMPKTSNSLGQEVVVLA